MQIFTLPQKRHRNTGDHFRRECMICFFCTAILGAGRLCPPQRNNAVWKYARNVTNISGAIPSGVFIAFNTPGVQNVKKQIFLVLSGAMIPTSLCIWMVTIYSSRYLLAKHSPGTRCGDTVAPHPSSSRNPKYLRPLHENNKWVPIIYFQS